MSYVMKLGSTGQAVVDLQQKLFQRGVLPQLDEDGNSNIDGKFGRLTQDAVRQFQHDQRLTEDGAVGENTASALGLAFPAMAVPSGHVLTPSQLKRLAEVVDTLVPTGPLDLFDDRAIAWLVTKLDGFLADHIPPSILSFLNDLSNGIEGHDLSALKKRLSSAVNARINVPFLSEETEARIISLVVNVIVEALLAGRTFDKALEQAAKLAR